MANTPLILPTVIPICQIFLEFLLIEVAIERIVDASGLHNKQVGEEAAIDHLEETEAFQFRFVLMGQILEVAYLLDEERRTTTDGDARLYNSIMIQTAFDMYHLQILLQEFQSQLIGKQMVLGIATYLETQVAEMGGRI